MGTLQYAAPEVFKGVVTEWSDQYSLAVTYCQLRTGQLPFPPPPPRFTSTYQRPQPDLWSLPYGERRVLQRALDPVPQGRWPNCREMMEQLSKAITPAAEPAPV
jgi:serine/threonine protein kinase